jgi:hypothetical protein
MVFVGLLVIQQRVAGVDTPQPSAAEKGSSRPQLACPPPPQNFTVKLFNPF